MSTEQNRGSNQRPRNPLGKPQNRGQQKQGRRLSDRPRGFPQSPDSVAGDSVSANSEPPTYLPPEYGQPGSERPGSEQPSSEWPDPGTPSSAYPPSDGRSPGNSPSGHDLAQHPGFPSQGQSGYIPPREHGDSAGQPSQPSQHQAEWPQADARFAPPSARPPSLYDGQTYQGPQSGPYGNQQPIPNPDAYPQSGAPGYASPQPPAGGPTYSPQPYGSPQQPVAQPYGPPYPSSQPGGPPGGPPVGPPRTDTRPYSPPPPAPARDEPKQRSSVGKSILKFLGWTLLLTAVMIALVLGGGLYSIQNAANQFLNPNTTTTVVTKAPVVASLKKVNKQIVIEHNNMVDVDYQEAPEGWLSLLPVQQSFVVLLRGTVPAGFDLSELNEDDVWISNDGSKIQLVLPPPVIFEDSVAVNFEESRVVTEGDTCPNFICAEDLEAIQTVILPQGRQLLIETSRESGIMEQAAQMGVSYYESLLRSLGFDEVQIFIRTDIGVEQVNEVPAPASE